MSQRCATGNGPNESLMFFAQAKASKTNRLDSDNNMRAAPDGASPHNQSINRYSCIQFCLPEIRRNSTDLEDLFIAHISGMDAFARALIVADEILTQSDYSKIKNGRYASFDGGDGNLFESGNLTMEDLDRIAKNNGEPQQISGKQELLEQLATRDLRRLRYLIATLKSRFNNPTVLHVV